MYEKECLPVKKKVCSPISSYLPFYHDDVCDTEYETICTTIVATKYVKVGQQYEEIDICSFNLFCINLI